MSSKAESSKDGGRDRRKVEYLDGSAVMRGSGSRPSNSAWNRIRALVP